MLKWDRGTFITLIDIDTSFYIDNFSTLKPTFIETFY